MADRTILAVTGTDRDLFLQGLVSNDMARAKEGIAYAALLTPQGKYLADFFLIGQPDRVLIDVATPLAPGLMQRLSMYKLRADVQIAETGVQVQRGTGPAPDGALQDPRHPAMGWRIYGTAGGDNGTDWDAIRVEHLIPETLRDLGPETYILEAGFERLHGVDFRKGCYVGQEVTARMKHKTELRKGLGRVGLSAPVPSGTAITDAQRREVGTILTVSGDRALAQLRFDWVSEDMTAGPARVTFQAR